MVAPVALANAIANATGLADLTPPFLPGRLWQMMRGQDPDPGLRQAKPSGATIGAPNISGGLRGRGGVTIAAPRQQVWNALLDPVSLKAVIPGCESIEATGAETFHALVLVSVAGIGGRYDAQIRIFDRNEPDSLRLSGRGESKLGFGQGEAFVMLTDAGPGETLLTYEYGADVGGRVAAFGQRMLDGVVRLLLAGFFERLRAHLRGEAANGGIVTRLRSWVAMLRLLWGPK